MLIVKKLSKAYEKTLAVKEASFQVNAGEIAVLLGPNGAGKSTTIKSIAGLLKFSGEISVGGHPNKSVDAKRCFGFVPEAPALYDALTVWEHLEFIARAYRLGEGWTERAEALLKRFDLDDKRTKLGKELSKGMQQKVSLLCALIIEPKMIMFDEPMIGLDPKAIKELKAVFMELRSKGCAVLISTHIIDSIDEVWDRVLVMHQGEIVLSATRAEVAQSGESLEEAFFRLTEIMPESLPAGGETPQTALTEESAGSGSTHETSVGSPGEEANS